MPCRSRARWTAGGRPVTRAAARGASVNLIEYTKDGEPTYWYTANGKCKGAGAPASERRGRIRDPWPSFAGRLADGLVHIDTKHALT